MAKAWVSTTTMTETMRTPQLTQRAPMSLPICVLGLKSPQPTVVMVMTVIHIMLEQVVRGEVVQTTVYATLKANVNISNEIAKMVEMKEKGLSLKIDLRANMTPGQAPQSLQILPERGDMQRHLMRTVVPKKETLKQARMMSMQLSLEANYVFDPVSGSTQVILTQTSSINSYGMMRHSTILKKISLNQHNMPVHLQD